MTKILLAIIAITLLLTSNIISAKTQVISTDIINSSDNTISISIIHSSDDIDNLQGLGLLLHYDSNILEFIRLENILNTNLTATDIKSNKTIDTKGVINTAWGAITRWNIVNNQVLYTAVFKYKSDIQASTKINFTSISKTNGYEFIADDTWVYKY